MSQKTDSASPTPALPAPAKPASRFSLPAKIGLVFGALGLLLTIAGLLRGGTPLGAANILVALLLGGGVWFVIAWAVATAAVDVEQDLE